MVGLFVGDDAAQGVGCCRVDDRKFKKLFLHVPEHDRFDGYGGRGNRALTQQARDASQYETADPAQMVTSTAPPPSPHKFRSEQSAVPPLMAQEFAQLLDHARCGPPR